MAFWNKKKKEQEQEQKRIEHFNRVVEEAYHNAMVTANALDNLDIEGGEALRRFHAANYIRDLAEDFQSVEDLETVNFINNLIFAIGLWEIPNNSKKHNQIVDIMRRNRMWPFLGNM